MNCNTVQPMLSEYIDNVLSARDTWEVDKHLADCNACGRALNEMRQTVRLIGETPRLEIGAEFMENLHTRISALAPDRPRTAWMASLRAIFRPRAFPAWGATLGTCALALFMIVHRVPTETGLVPPIATLTAPPLMQTARNQSVALAAANPFGDPAAAALIASNASTGSHTLEAGDSTTSVQ